MRPVRFWGACLVAVVGILPLLGVACDHQTPGLTAPAPPAFVDDTDPARARISTIKRASSPLVVDWQPEYRLDLEVRAKRGPAVIKFTEKTFELLPRCEPTGQYRYVGVTPKRQNVRMKSLAELHANLPLSAFQLAGKFEQSGGFDVALRMVGERVLDRPTLRTDELKGSCEGATHFVSAMTVGAFTFATGAARALGATVGALGFGTSAGASGATEVLQEDGELEACASADPRSDDAPPKCGAILRLQIVPLGAAPAAAAETACGDGLKWNGAACVSIKRAALAGPTGGEPPGYECDADDAVTCRIQCERGNLASCVNLGMLGERASDLAGAAAAYEKACTGGEAKGCTWLSAIHERAHRYAEAAPLAMKACMAGQAGGCTNMALLAYFGRGVPENPPVAFQLWDRASQLREYDACSNAGVMVLLGTGGVRVDDTRARRLFELACDATGSVGCVNLGLTQELGIGAPRDLPRAARTFVDQCEKGAAFGCVWGGMLIEQLGKPAAALQLYEHGCGLQGGGGCLSTDELRRRAPGAYDAEGYDRRSCDGGDARGLACYNAAIAVARDNRGDAKRARALLDKACHDGGLEKACRR